jgi:hypothetical protein
MRISQTTEQISALRAFQDQCEIESITLQSCTVTRAKAGTEFCAPYSVKPTLSNTSFFHIGNQFVVEVSFEYAAWDSAETPERIFLVNCTFEVCYRMRDAYVPNEAEKSSFSRGTAVFNCWPYAREFLRDITARLGHQAPVLPLLRITPKKTEPKADAVGSATSPTVLPPAAQSNP